MLYVIEIYVFLMTKLFKFHFKFLEALCQCFLMCSVLFQCGSNVGSHIITASYLVCANYREECCEVRLGVATSSHRSV